MPARADVVVVLENSRNEVTETTMKFWRSWRDHDGPKNQSGEKRNTRVHHETIETIKIYK